MCTSFCYETLDLPRPRSSFGRRFFDQAFLSCEVLGIDNGIGLTPPRGWRSWNAFDCLEPRSILTQAHVKAQMDAVLDKSRLVDGKPTSLAELGFDWISMDDGWQRCNCSVRQDLDPKLPKCDGNLCFGGHCSWHDAAGVPVVRKDRFPNMKELVDYGHAHELKVGTYLNTCICNEHGSPHYSEDVKWMQDLGFDGVKIDSCGSSNNVTRWAELFNQTGKAIRIENCHNSWPDFETGFCPMNFFRTGGDISADISSILNEAYATVDAADLPKPRSGPGCWAYPDMSEACPHAQNFTEPGCAWQEEVKQRRASRPKPPAASANTDFALTPKGELQNALGCLHAAPVGGIQLWAKPLSDSSTAILLINPSAENEALAWPVADLPQRFSGAEKGFRCQPARCGARDVWAGRRFAVSDEIHVSLKPWGSTFLILHSEDTIAV
ncbi:unnamed protein product [Effrenium voratum]|nr:unnamed protein product [Effrenium voratum]